MKIQKYFIMIIFVSLLLFLIPNVCHADVEVTKLLYSNNGSSKFTFTGLELDITHEYEFGLTKTPATEVTTWYLITEYTTSTAIVDVMTTTKELREVVNVVDNGYITIRDKSSGEVVLEPYSVDLKIPFLNLTNYTVIPNGKDLDNSTNNIQIGLRNKGNSEAYYQYEKITDEKIINKYKEIKAQNGDVTEIQNMLKSTAPTSNWSKWEYWNGYDSSTGMNGFGYTQRNVSVPDSGLYYMWLYFSGNNLKNIYGYILVDNLATDIALEGISLPKTETVELGKTITLTPIFNPVNATNKIVTWSSSDETIAIVDNAGKVTSKKVGSTIITVISQDGNKKANCTITVTEVSNNNSETGNGTNNNNNNNSNNNNNTQKENLNQKNDNPSSTNNTNNNTNNSQPKTDPTIVNVILPFTGINIKIIVTILLMIIVSLIIFKKLNEYKDVK